MAAAAEDEVDLVKLLLARGADAKLYQADNETPIMAALSGRGSFGGGGLANSQAAVEVLKLLHDAGTEVNIMSIQHHLLRTRGGTALHFAVRAGSEEAVKLLVSWGVDVNARDPDGLTALDYAMARGYVPFLAQRQPPQTGACEALRESGATVELAKASRLAAGGARRSAMRQPSGRSQPSDALEQRARSIRRCIRRGTCPSSSLRRAWRPRSRLPADPRRLQPCPSPKSSNIEMSRMNRSLAPPPAEGRDPTVGAACASRIARCRAPREITATPLTPKERGGLTLLQGAGCNVVAMPGADGALLIDGGLAAELQGAAQGRGEGHGSATRVSTLINTHWHPEQTGSNLPLGRQSRGHHRARGDAAVRGTQGHLGLLRGHVRTISRESARDEDHAHFGVFEFAGQHIDYEYLPAAHTDGDLYVHFPEANVLVAGGPVSGSHWPVLDIHNGGWLGGPGAGVREARDGGQT